MLLTINASRDSTLIQRNVYSALDFLSDIGGIQGLFVSLFGLMITLFNTTSFEEHLIRQLYTYRVKPSRFNLNSSHDFSEQLYFRQLSLYGLRCCFKRPNRERRALKKAMEKLNQETDIVQILRFMRVFKATLLKGKSS